MRTTSEWLADDVSRLERIEFLQNGTFDPGPRGAWVSLELIGAGGSGGPVSLPGSWTGGGGGGERLIVHDLFVAQAVNVVVGQAARISASNETSEPGGSSQFGRHIARGGKSGRLGYGGAGGGALGLAGQIGSGYHLDGGSQIQTLPQSGSWMLGIGSGGGGLNPSRETGGDGASSSFYDGGRGGVINNVKAGGGGGGWYGPGADAGQNAAPNTGAGGGGGGLGGSGRVILIVRRM